MTSSGNAFWKKIGTDSPPTNILTWVQTGSGVVGTGYFDGSWWVTDGFRVLDAWDVLTYWAEITYPEPYGS